MKRCLLCWFHEVTLKKGNRNFFEVALRENVKLALKGLPLEGLYRLSGRLVIEPGERSDLAEYLTRLSRVFGLASYTAAWQSTQDLDRLQEDLWSLVRERDFETFKIHARRSASVSPLSSMDINRRLGALVQERSGRRVQLKHPDLTCWVEFVEHHAFLFFGRNAGVAGLPAGTSGKVVALLSGGIDSPVAAYRMMKRGCRVIFVHFHSYPHTSIDSQEKVRELVRILNRYQYHSLLYMVPFAECQRRIVAFAPAEVRVLLYRRLMVRLADRIAWRKRAPALVSGDSLGQVASQTLPNLGAVSDATRRPLMRPLLGWDKEEIIAEARAIGTYPISILPDEDCCTLFVPKHPAIRARVARLREIEEQLELEGLIEETLKAVEVERFSGNATEVQAGVG